MTKLRYILICACLFVFGTLPAAAAQGGSGETVDVKGIVFGHIGDSYEWHITSWNGRELSVPLPVILRSETGRWDVFMSSRLAHGAEYGGYRIAAEGPYEGKIVERIDGEDVRPLDLSITKTAFALMLNSLILICIVLGAVEMFVMMVHDDLIKSCVGRDYKRFAPYLLTVFFFIFVNNLMGLIPFFPGGANVSGNIAVTLVLALCTFLAVNLFGTREYWKEIFWPEVPAWLKVPVPMMPAIELVGIFTKPFALMIRLFANMMAGHAVILSLTCVIFVTVSMGAAVNASMTFVSVLFSIFMNLLELLVAFLQAYVFTMLSAVFIGLARVRHEPHEEAEI